MYKAIDIASYFINKGVSPLKLQKLLYYSQIWYFVKFRRKLFVDNIQAWVYGPVVYDIWNTFRFIKRSNNIPSNKAKDVFFDQVTANHLSDVWNAYGHLTGSQLVDTTHNELPWQNSRKGIPNNQSSGNEVMINDYTTKNFSLVNGNIPQHHVQSSLGHFGNI